MKKIVVNKTSSKGIAMGKVFLLEEQDLSPEICTEKICQEEQESAYERAVAEVIEDLKPLVAKSDIFAGHLELAKDIALKEGVFERIRTNQCGAQEALHDVSKEFQQVFEMMDDEYMRERASDILDIRNRIMRKLKHIPEVSFENLSEKVILAAKDLAPSDTAKMNLDYIMGFITEQGGVTSHVSIMARGMGIPALVGVSDFMKEVRPGDFVIMDASQGLIIVEPEQEDVDEYEKKAVAFYQYQKNLEETSSLPVVTVDGRTLEVCGNVGNVDGIKNAFAYKIDGIGLFRSEFLYMEKDHFPTEEEQFAVYKEAAELLEGRELTIRTLDIGGDKGLDYFEFPKEENPFLGYRAIRIGLDQVDILKTQLRALLRAGVYGNIRIMFPMIISMEELVRARAVLEECKKELSQEFQSFDENIQTGIMIETPAAVIMAEELAEKADFFSIGTNDLTQYLLAVDRGNEKIAEMYNSFHPAVLRAIYQTIKAGHKHNCKVGMCGEFASDSKAIELLLGMGLDEFSVAPGEAAGIKHILRSTSFEQAKQMAEKVLKQSNIQSIMKLIEEQTEGKQI